MQISRFFLAGKVSLQHHHYNFSLFREKDEQRKKDLTKKNCDNLHFAARSSLNNTSEKLKKLWIAVHEAVSEEGEFSSCFAQKTFHALVFAVERNKTENFSSSLT